MYQAPVEGGLESLDITAFSAGVQGVWGVQLPIASEGRNAPGRAHDTGTVYKCAVRNGRTLAEADLSLTS